MINLPCNMASTPQATPYQNVPMQTSQYNFPTCQQRQTSALQMQATACTPGSPQGPFVYQPDAYVVTQQQYGAPGTSQSATSPCHPAFQSNPVPTQASCGQLSQSVLDQIRACISNTAPIFILPGGCQQPSQQQQPAPFAPVVPPQATTAPAPSTMVYPPPSGLTYPTAYYPSPPPFYPYPMPLPFCDSFARREVARDDCGCCRKRDVDLTDVARCRYGDEMWGEHRCTSTLDDTVCSKRNCPSSLHLQALASQFLSMQGIIACAATRLVLRKVPGSSVTTSMEETMAKAQKAISVLTKDQLLTESRNAQQVNALINLHMTASPPPNIIPILTLVQLKMNLLKTQVEALVNQKLMEIQGVGVEVDPELIDPAVLALKSDAELRDFLTVLRQKECDERMNVNFAPYRSQRAIAETRLYNIQNKIRQVETEFDRRRCAMLPPPTLSSRIVQQFSRPCYSTAFEATRRLYTTVPVTVPPPLRMPRSPDPFVCAKPRGLKRLLLKRRACNPETTPAASTPPANPSPEATVDTDSRAKKRSQSPERRRSNTETCSCCSDDESSSDESVGEAKKKLRRRIAQEDSEVITKVGELGCDEASSLMNQMSNAVELITERRSVCMRKRGSWTENETRSDQVIVPCDAKRYTTTIYINITDVESESAKTEKDVITPGTADGKIGESRESIEIDRALNLEASADWPKVRQLEEEEVEVISKTDEPSKTRVVEVRDSAEIGQNEARIADDGAISDTQEAQRPLKPEEEAYTEDERKEENETSPLIADETIERSAGEAKAVNKCKKKTRFQIVSVMTDIVCCGQPEYQSRREIGSKMAERDGEEMSVCTKRSSRSAAPRTPSIDPRIKGLDKCPSIRGVLKGAIAPVVTEKDRPKYLFPKRLDLPKLYVDRPCQTTPKVAKKDKRVFIKDSLRTNVFPPLKHKLHKRAIDDEEQRDGIKICPYPKVGITRAIHSTCSHEGTSETRRRDGTSDCPTFKDAFIPEVFSLIGNAAHVLLNKIITLNGKLRTCGNVMSRKSENLNQREGAPSRVDRQSISGDHDPSASLQRTLDSQQTVSKRDSRDTNLSSRMSMGEGSSEEIRKIRHSIIEDRRNDARYLLTSTCCDCDLARDLGRPYKVRRSLLIRSRLRDSASSRDQPAFCLIKRARTKMPEDEAKSEEDVGTMTGKEASVLKDSEKFWTLPEVSETSGNDGDVSETTEHGDEAKKRISRERSYDDTASSEMSAAVQKRKLIDNSELADELVTNVHDYFRLQTEINTNVYNFITSEIDTVRKTHGERS